MKPIPKPNRNPSRNGGPPAAQRPKVNPVVQQIVAEKARRKRDLADQWKFFVIGGLAIAGVFVGLNLTKKVPEKPILVTLPDGARVEETGAGRVANPEDGSLESMFPEIAGGDAGKAQQPAVDPVRPAEPPVQTADEAGKMAKEPVLVLADLDSRRENAIQRDKELFKRAIDGKAWDAYRALLARSITAGMERLSKGQGVNRFDPLWSEPVLYQTFLRWQVLGKFTESEIGDVVPDSYSAEMLTWLCYNPAAMEEFLLTFQPDDDSGKVLRFLTDAWPNLNGMMEKYFSLTLACAVVFDRDVSIPHPVGGGEYGAQTLVDPMKRLLWYVEKNEKGLLAAPVHHSSARDLVWVVCAPVSTTELDWALDKLHMNRKNWGNAYGMIEYLMERAVKGINPYEEYSFSEILKEGGICGDQSYFCTNTARAQGIPAMTLTGETDLGGHAWVGIKVKPDEWTTGVGRIGGVSKGQTGNPQTGKSITEQEVQLWSERAHQSKVTTLSVARHLWLASFFDATAKDEPGADSVRLANKIGPSFTETWAALYGLLRKQMVLSGDPEIPNNLEEWKDFAKSMRREFKDNPRMAKLASDAEMEYIFPYGDEGDAARTLLRERRRINRDSGEQKDLIADSLKREAELIHKRGGADATRDISHLYDSALRKYGGSITGFKMMAEDYFGYMKDDQELARKAARDIELAFKRVVETGTKDWFRAKTESSIYQMICGYYRTAGDEDRAVLLEKRYQVLLRRAERGAL